MPKVTRFESLLEAVPEALVGMDQKGEIRFVNRQTELLFGYDRDDLIGRHVGTLLPEPLWQIYVEHKNDYFADPRTRSSGVDLELNGRRGDGTDLLVNVSLSHIDTGDVLLAITAVRDLAKQQVAVKTAQLTAAVVEYSNDAIIGTTLGGTITSWNPAAERLYGYSSESIIGKSGSILTPEGRAGEFFANLDHVKDGKAVEHFETTRVRKDGMEVPVSLTVAPILDENGVIVGASAVHHDVSEQRRAFEVGQRMAAMVEFSAEAIVGTTLEGVITSWNPAAERLYGYSGEEIIGKSAKQVIPQDRVGEMHEILAEIKAGHSVVNFETIRLRKDGTAFPAVLTVSPIHSADGTVVAVDTIIRDATEQRQALEASRRITAMVEGSDDAIVSATLEGVITSWNPAAERMFGYSGHEIIGKPSERLIPEARLNEAQAILARIRAGQSVGHVETTRVRKDGTVFPVSLTVSPIFDADAAIVGVSAICRDMTEKEYAARYARSLIEAALDPMVTISPEGKIQDVNEATTKITGLSREELIGSDYAQYVTEPEKALAFFGQVFEQGSISHFPLTVRHRDGTLTDVMANASVYYDIGGNVLGVFAAGHDVTGQKEAFETAQRLAAIVEGSDEAIIGKTLEGIVTSWNPAAERLYGYPSEEIIGQSIDVVIPEARAGEHASILSRIKAGRSVDHLETSGSRKDGTLFRALLTVSPVRDADGTIIGASTIAREIEGPEPPPTE